jgi:hypothetical protein
MQFSRMTAQASDIQPPAPLHAKSVDMIRVIRRSVRCFLFGLIGVVPLIGHGLAWQSLRLCDEVMTEMGTNWPRPPLWAYWMIGLGAMLILDYFFGLIGAFTAFGMFLGLQTFHLWRSFPASATPIWNPGRRHVLWGIALAYAGYFGSCGSIGLIAFRLSRASWPL